MRSKLEEKARKVMDSLGDYIDPELHDLVYDAILVEFDDWEDIVYEHIDREKNMGPIEQEFRDRRKQEE